MLPWTPARCPGRRILLGDRLRWNAVSAGRIGVLCVSPGEAVDDSRHAWAGHGKSESGEE